MHEILQHGTADKQINYEESFTSICPSLTVCISVYTLYTEAFAFIYKNPTPLCDRHKTYLIRTQSKSNILGVVPFIFIHSKNGQIDENLQKQNGKESANVVYSWDVSSVLGTRNNCKVDA